ncbi:hypothetical protein JJC03_12860 [Flavobacterium oreochromis]|uniref:hypothetical protein n=1 Tax=Flavobacterium oreochromis TaxID=2906078 RepID=UPI001CE523AE|nr:hypothetical protein [Flavobacterium oreochromis]QYS85932.1 hypothetical protein JJC03_12860 [Flavobacterium oreochromis]
MNKIVLLFSFFLLNLTIQAQKKKSTDNTSSNLLLAKNGEASVVLNKKRDMCLVVLKDSILLTKNKPDLIPNTIKINQLKVKNSIFYHVSWKSIEKKRLHYVKN